jgi:hypothetical protein
MVKRTNNYLQNTRPSHMNPIKYWGELSIWRDSILIFIIKFVLMDRREDWFDCLLFIVK